jgi:long-chain acyl-CoA synthetase
MEITTLPRIIQNNVRNNPNLVAQYSKDEAGVFKPTTYAEMYREILCLAAALSEAGIKRGDHVGLISDNRKEWLITSFAIQCLGAADVPRGCDTMAMELGYILSFGDCKSVVLENEAQLAKIIKERDKLTAIERIILFDNNFDKSKYQNDLQNVRFYCYRELMERGKSLTADGTDGVKSIEAEIEQGKEDDLATIIFTSGTTGEPKGVMLSHKNIVHQARVAPAVLNNKAGEIWLTVLPVWHSFERAIQYIVLYPGGCLAYSKPIGKIMLADFQAVKPQWMAAVPRIWEALRAGVIRNVAAGGSSKKAVFNFFISVSTVHEKLKNLLTARTPQFKRRFVPFDILVSIIPFLLLSPLRALGNALVFKKIKLMFGGKFKAGLSGGAALPDAVDKFYAAAGILILEGYGLTEAAPILSVRHFKKPVPETIGPAFPDMQVIFRDPDTGKEVPPGKKGVLHAKGDQIMLGYYKKPEETAKVIDGEGWLNSGDIGLKTYKGEIKLTGRAKDTIVLLGGENIEPVPIENKIRDSDFIDHALVIGQDQKFLAALVVPNIEKIEAYAKENAITYMDSDHLKRLPEIKDLIQSEISAQINQKNGFRGFEMVYRCAVLPKPFEPGVELSGKQDYKRHVIVEMYKKEVIELFKD